MLVFLDCCASAYSPKYRVSLRRCVYVCFHVGSDARKFGDWQGCSFRPGQCLSLLQPRAPCFRLVSLIRRFFHALWFALLSAELSFNHCWFSSRYGSPSRLLVFMICIFLDFEVERVTMYLYFVASVSMVIVALSVVAGEQYSSALGPLHCTVQLD